MKGAPGQGGIKNDFYLIYPGVLVGKFYSTAKRTGAGVVEIADGDSVHGIKEGKVLLRKNYQKYNKYFSSCTAFSVYAAIFMHRCPKMSSEEKGANKNGDWLPGSQSPSWRR